MARMTETTGTIERTERNRERRVSKMDHTHAHTYEYGDLERVMN